MCVNLNAQDNLTGRQIMEKQKEASKLEGSEMVGTLKIINQKGRERIRKTSIATKSYGNDINKRIIIFLYPADVKGTGMLVFDYENKNDDMWIYMPALRKTRRIVSSEKGKSFMGSEFTNADISTPNLDDFNYKKLGTEQVNVDCWKIESTPKDEDIADENGYSKRIIYIGKKDFVIRKTVYYNLDNELHKILEGKNIKLIDTENKKYMATEMTMSNKQNGRKSIWIIEEIVVNPNIKDEYFTTDYLEKQ
ncbi:MAG: outer membrane lipoprotein-sorting protein [Bacteroidales bacterium]|nr:outer membrane lipoprotein-sorting protein [Bacteroidales bacterium]